MDVPLTLLAAMPPAVLPRVSLDFSRLRFKENSAAAIQSSSRMEQETDEAILQRVARGDEAAFADLYDRFAPSLFAIARRILADDQEARDALQDGFLYLWDKAAEFDPARGKAFSWAVMIFRNKAIDRLRAGRRRMRLNETAAEDLLDLESPSAERADLSAERAENAEAVRRAMRSLPDEQRKCIEWAFLRGLTHLQLSELLGAPLGTVKTNIRRGLLRLRDILQGGES
jgi:RNA polymerase sigma-70 factor (ECF subfamily)